MGLFGSKGTGSGARPDHSRVPRPSNGWAQMRKLLQAQEGLRVLDIGPTSAGNINLITQMGHSVYMANLAEEAGKPEWRIPEADGSTQYDVAGFLQQNLDFAGRIFDVVLLFDALDYVPIPFVQPIVDRLHQVIQPGGSLLAFFHGKLTGEETIFSRYHLTAGDHLELQRVSGPAVMQVLSNRQVEQVFAAYASYRFFLAKDALRDVVVTR